LDDVAQRIDGFKEALRRRATVEQEHGDLALQIKQQRAEVRHRERELAMELARVDNDLASFKAKLASLKSQQSAESLAVLQRGKQADSGLVWVVRKGCFRFQLRYFVMGNASPEQETILNRASFHSPGGGDAVGDETLRFGRCSQNSEPCDSVAST